ncbi:MAG TPA: hypothetical protein VF283_13135 [Bryobacteraceae bacterium]
MREQLTESATRPLKVWCLAPDQLDHIRPIELCFGNEAQFTYDSKCEPAGMAASRPDVVLCVNEFPLGISECLDTARALGIPTLLLQDGILEWRCQYENPLFGAGGGPPQHQPVLADKIACLGEQSGRVIRSWGNGGKVEVTGMPRLDHLLLRPRRQCGDARKRVLLMTAKNPGFTEAQREITLRSLIDVAAELKARPAVELVWRVAPQTARQLGLDNSLSEFSSQDLATVLEQMDLVITTPSTAILESMLLERPTAALDYHNVPRFVPTAWTISAREQILPVLDNMLARPGNRMDFQRFLLRDCLECNGPAAPRVASLIRRMTAMANKNRVCGLAQSSDDNQYESHDKANAVYTSQGAPPSLAGLYPDQSDFQITDIRVLQTKLARLRKRNTELEREIQARTIINGLFKIGRQVSKHLRKA